MTLFKHFEIIPAMTTPDFKSKRSHRHFFGPALALLAFLILYNAPAQAKTVDNILKQRSHSYPDLIQSIRFEQPIRFCNKVIPLDRQDVKQQLEKEMLLSLWDRPQVILWVKRSGKYFSHIEDILKKNGLSTDFKYVPVIESALRPHAGSRKGAIGYWQFLKTTGKQYGLTINARTDERRNIFKSTQAAANYLKDLKQRFNSDFLALAAYNMGEFSLENEIKAQNSRDFFSLYLPIETQRYIFKLITAKLIFENPEKYGFNFDPSDIYPPFIFDQANFKTDFELPLVLIAQAAGTTFKLIKEMNPEIRGYHISKGNHSILIPKGTAKAFKQKFHANYKSWQKSKKIRIHVVKSGESLAIIAQNYNIPLKRLLRLNNLSVKKMIHPGDRLLIE